MELNNEMSEELNKAAEHLLAAYRQSERARGDNMAIREALARSWEDVSDGSPLQDADLELVANTLQALSQRLHDEMDEARRVTDFESE